MPCWAALCADFTALESGKRLFMNYATTLILRQNSVHIQYNAETLKILRSYLPHSNLFNIVFITISLKKTKYIRSKATFRINDFLGRKC